MQHASTISRQIFGLFFTHSHALLLCRLHRGHDRGRFIYWSVWTETSTTKTAADPTRGGRSCRRRCRCSSTKFSVRRRFCHCSIDWYQVSTVPWCLHYFIFALCRDESMKTLLVLIWCFFVCPDQDVSQRMAHSSDNMFLAQSLVAANQRTNPRPQLWPHTSSSGTSFLEKCTPGSR